MAIAVFRSLEGENLEDVANRLFQKWRLGQKRLDNGVLLVVFVEDRKLRLEVGYGLEAALPDAEAAQIIRGAIAPRFREQRCASGPNLYMLLLLAFVALTVGGLAWEASHQRGYTAGRRGWISSGGGWYGGGWGGGGSSGGGGGF